MKIRIMKTLHVINGDGTAYPFQHSKIEGDRIVWRGALCEGLSPSARSLEAFRSERIPFLSRHFKAPLHRVQSMFYIPLERLSRLEGYGEIVLWFENDLFCQANLLFLAAYLYHQQGLDARISVVSPDSHPEVPDFRGMGQLSPIQLESLLPNRISLDREALAFAAEIWELWRMEQWEKVAEFAQTASSEAWPHLAEAMALQQQVQPDTETGLGLVEHFVLQSLRKEPLSKRDLFLLFLKQLPKLGYGDLQFFNVVEKLEEEHIRLVEGRYQIKQI